MEKFNLEFIEDVIAYASFLGEDKEIIFPSIVDYISEHTIINDRNRNVLFKAKDFFVENKALPSIYDLKAVMVTDEEMDMYSTYLKNFKNFKKHEFTRTVLFKYIEEFFRQRIINNIMTESFIKSNAGEELEIEEIYFNIEEAMGIKLCDDLGLDLFRDVDDYIETLKDIDGRISTGFPWLDEQLGGGFLASGSALYTLASPSNLGKSNFIKSLACNAVDDGKNVLVVSLEMSRYIYANRFVAEMANLPIGRLVENEAKAREFLSGAEGEGKGRLIIKDFPTGSLTSSALWAYITKTQKQMGFEFDVIFVDYPELMKPTLTFNGRHDLAVGNLYVEVRALSFYLETPICVVAQLNREGYGEKQPTMTSIGSSIGIITCSDFVGFLYTNEEQKALNQISMSVGKSRFGPVNKSKRFKVCQDTLRIIEAPYEEEVSPDELSISLSGDGSDPIDPNDFFSNIFED